MNRGAKNLSNDEAREIAIFLLEKGIPQTKIAGIVKKSQSWVSKIKREHEIASSAREEGYLDAQNEIIKNIGDRMGSNLLKKFQPNILMTICDKKR